MGRATGTGTPPGASDGITAAEGADKIPPVSGFVSVHAMRLRKSPESAGVEIAAEAAGKPPAGAGAGEDAPPERGAAGTGAPPGGGAPSGAGAGEVGGDVGTCATGVPGAGAPTVAGGAAGAGAPPGGAGGAGCVGGCSSLMLNLYVGVL